MKLIIVGDDAGKTTYARLLNNDNYRPFQIGQYTIYEEGMFDDDYELYFYENADCAILMTTPESLYENYYKEKIKRLCGNIPIVTVVNKIDNQEIIDKDDDKIYMSCKEKINIYQPFEKLLKL